MRVLWRHGFDDHWSRSMQTDKKISFREKSEKSGECSFEFCYWVRSRMMTRGSFSFNRLFTNFDFLRLPQSRVEVLSNENISLGQQLLVAQEQLAKAQDSEAELTLQMVSPGLYNNMKSPWDCMYTYKETTSSIHFHYSEFHDSEI